MATDLMDFSPQAWQPFIAAVIAFAGAVFVFRGAKLAYRAAMAKLALDEWIHETETRRKRRGIFLRLDYNLYLMWQDASRLTEELKQPSPLCGPSEKFISKAALKFTSRELDEAWSNLDMFREPVAQGIRHLQISLINFDEAVTRIVDADLHLQIDYTSPSAALRDLRDSLAQIAKEAKFIRENLDTD